MIAIADPNHPGGICLPGPSALPRAGSRPAVPGHSSGWMDRVVGPYDENGVRQTLLICDLFCGAGGFTTGAMRALRELGLAAVMAAVNHWPVAIATHHLNHPHVRHYIEDVKAANPADIVPERYLDLLLCSPSCVFFSRARGGKPSSDQKRMDPEAIIRWIDQIDVRVLVCENVPEFKDWCRIDPATGRPKRGCKGEYFRRWIRKLERRGYVVEWRILTCADYGDATSRQRWFLIARKDGVPVEWPLQTHSKTGTDVCGRPLPRWRGALEIIDWHDHGTSIFGRRPRRKGYRAPKGSPRWLRALALNTLKRVRAGTDRFTGPWRHAFAAAIDEEMELVRLDEAGLPRPEEGAVLTFRFVAGEAVRTDPAEARVVFQPGELTDVLAEGEAVLVRPVAAGWPGVAGWDPARCRLRRPTLADSTSRAGEGSPGASPRESGAAYTCANRSDNAPRLIGQPVAPVLTGTGGGLWLAMPDVQGYLLSQQSGGAPRATLHPVPAVATGGAIAFAVPALDARPYAIRRTADGMAAVRRYLIAVNHGDGPRGSNGRRVRDIAEPVLGLTTTRGLALLDPVVSGWTALQGYTSAFYGGNVGTEGAAGDLASPLRAVTTHDRHSFCLPAVSSYLVPQFGERVGQAPRTHPIDIPAPAVTGHGAGALVVPLILRFDNAGAGGTCVRGVGDPLWTTTQKAGCAIVESYIISPRHSRLGGGPAPRHVVLPVPTLTGGGSQIGVVSAAAARLRAGPAGSRCPEAPAETLELSLAGHAAPSPAARPRGRVIWVDGCLVRIDVAFRMLRNAELARSHSFDDEESRYEFVGTAGEQTKQIGNSVPVSTARALVLSQIRRIPGVLALPRAGAPGRGTWSHPPLQAAA